MKLKECKFGEIVIENLKGFSDEDKVDRIKRIGHIVGLTINSTDEVIPIVSFASKGFNLNSDPHPIHHTNLDIFDKE